MGAERPPKGCPGDDSDDGAGGAARAIARDRHGFGRTVPPGACRSREGAQHVSFFDESAQRAPHLVSVDRNGPTHLEKCPKEQERPMRPASSRERPARLKFSRKRPTRLSPPCLRSWRRGDRRVGRCRRFFARAGRRRALFARVGRCRKEVARAGRCRAEVARVGRCRRSLARVGRHRQYFTRVGRRRARRTPAPQITTTRTAGGLL